MSDTAKSAALRAADGPAPDRPQAAAGPAGRQGARPQAVADEPGAKPGQGTGQNPGQNTGQNPDGAPDRPAGQKPNQRQGQGGRGTAGAAAPITVRPVAGPAKARPRHRGMAATFALVVLLPTLLAGLYLFLVASDQYASRVAFSVRTEESSSAIELLGGLTNLSGSSSSDTDILYEYIHSQELVEEVDEALDLRSIYAPEGADPVFAFSPDGTIEDLLDYWGRMVRIDYDSGTGLIELQVQAFAPEDARAVAQQVFDRSSVLVNELSSIAREDATRYAREELDRAVERLKRAREAMTAFRSRTQIVDPTADIQSQMGLMSTLQQQLADALIEHDLLLETNASESDPRVTQAERRIDVIRARIADERRKLGAGGTSPNGEEYATLISDYERLSVDREFAEQAYIAALGAFDAALSDAQRKNRYLAAYIKPTIAQRSEYPRRGLLTAMTALFAFMAWAVAMLIYYSVRDRR